MERLTKWAFNNKAAVGLLIAMALVIGVFSYTTLPMEFMPEADNPQVTVTVLGQGQNAGTMESQVTKPMEQAVGAIKGKTEMFSTSGDGYAQVNLYFDSKTDMKQAAQDVQKAVDNVPLPDGVMKPFVVQLNTSMIPVSELTISFKDGLTEQNVQKAEDEIVPALQKLKGVANVSLGGKPESVVSVTADAAKLAARHVTYPQLMTVLQGRSLSVSLGEQTLNGQAGNVNVTSTVDSLDMLKELPVAPGVKLEDVASVQFKQQQESVSRSGGKEVLFAIVTKEANANAVEVGKEVQKEAEKLSESGEVQVEVLVSTSDMVVDSVNSMMREVLLGALFATIVILLFLRNLRATLVTAISIPLSLAVTLYLLKASGITLNIITLGAVAVAVGRLVDDSIVVIENIFRRLQKEKFSLDMIVSSTKEVAGAITSSTIATVAVFLPMGMLRGSLQAFLLPFALTVTYSLLTSLVVALTVVPLLSSWMLKQSHLREPEPSRRFVSFLNWNLRYKWVTLSLTLVLFAGSIAAYVLMPKAALDSSDASFVSVQLSYPSDVPVKEVLDQGRQLERTLMEQEQAKTVILQSGNSSDGAQFGNVSSLTQVDLMVILKEGADAEKLVDYVNGLKKDYEGATLTAATSGLISGGSSAVENIDIIGDDYAAISKVGDEVQAAIEGLDGVNKVTNNMKDTKSVYSFEVDPALANGQEVAQQLGAMLRPVPLGTIEWRNNPVNVLLEPMAAPQSEQDLQDLTVVTASGPVKITKLAKFEVQNQPAMLYHKEGKTYLRISAEIDPKKVSLVGGRIKEQTDKIQLPEGVTLALGGASADQAGDFKDLGMTALISIGLVYLIMVLTFKTLRAPLAIMLSLPLAAIGAVAALIVSRVTPDFTALFGALMLIGIVVTNAIVLIDRIRHNEQHMTIREAILEAASVRMRPILMTAIATICAMLPLLFHPSKEGSIVSQSLAIVVVGGLAAATLLTLFVIPAVYELLYFRKSARQRRSQASQAGAEARTAEG
ncbi:multidrug transporter AcrB [Paenibacillus yonginensis]|uniref:Multidrug transporter AcrB n=1 Tax=Paenibacillus yonginensis TaxID=1462996 RepID=A0A1B1MVX6_9BACL|nr:efflux RND transporter permease subunit [Paenibacillus yonginensis]ANS73326.1 multidrug transporter AcrB [Paenibacillus yonginensis]